MKIILKYLICNLKGNKTYPEILAYKEALMSQNTNTINFILAPTSIYLPLFKNTNLTLCAQDINLNESLKLTGDITIDQLKSLDVSYVIIGHFERRKYYKETEHEIISKIKRALANNLKVIYCIGENIYEIERKVEYQVIEKQIARVFNKLSLADLKNIIIAYEPTYLIAHKTTYDFLKIKSMVLFIKKLVKDYYDINIPVVFGGSINENNITELTELETIDGFIICTAILQPENLFKIITKIATK